MADDIDTKASSPSTDKGVPAGDTTATHTAVESNENSQQNIEIQLNNTDKNSNNDNDTDIETEVVEEKDQFYTANAHRLRRIYHVSMFSIIPILYIWFVQAIADGIGITVPKLMSFLIFLAILLECIRLKKRWIMFGCREYERDHISAQAWGSISAYIVLLLAFPRTYSIAPVITMDANNKTKGSEAFACFGQMAIPIIWSLGFGDPLLGELKQYVRTGQMKAWLMYLIAYVVLFVIWILCFLWCGTPWWLAIIMPPIAIIAEKPSIPHIDDNGLMLLVPLLATLILEPWFPQKCNQTFYQ